ncbi:N-methyl-L-tryptophan oxidase [Alkalihalobacillus sp. BA299]|uniref:N-methyl-L-tryptophan oxidase n=1 Tax=Alkalihalobacillus sp. BA299 TaxID=2815938 RepID=UPI001ADB9506|nr:N-methyl-L-tryptophan oxidase [Alkalihalobacillus sp. BA299]
MIIEKDYDVIVVGGGSMGTAASYFLAKQNLRVLLIDQHTIPNEYSSHHGQTRMLRFGYGQGEKYVSLVKSAYQLWKELEEKTNKKLYYQTGALMVGKPNSTFVEETLKSSINNDLPYESLSAKEIMERWPGITIPTDYIGSFDPLAGFLLSKECIATYKEQAVLLGVTVLEEEEVTSIDMAEEQITILTANGNYVSPKLVVTAGVWIPKLLVNTPLSIDVLRKPVGWFTPTIEGLYDMGQFPAVVFDSDIGHYYGFPNFEGTGYKVGRHDTGQPCDPNLVDRTFGAYKEDEGDLRSFLEMYLPQAAGELAHGGVCMYSLTPDSDFIIDFHPQFANVVIAGGFSGHGFKFASVVGSILSDLMVYGETPHDISSFNIQRFKKIGVKS